MGAHRRGDLRMRKRVPQLPQLVHQGTKPTRSRQEGTALHGGNQLVQGSPAIHDTRSLRSVPLPMHLYLGLRMRPACRYLGSVHLRLPLPPSHALRLSTPARPPIHIKQHCFRQNLKNKNGHGERQLVADEELPSAGNSIFHSGSSLCITGGGGCQRRASNNDWHGMEREEPQSCDSPNSQKRLPGIRGVPTTRTCWMRV